jgi:hypothetical protein
MKLFPMNKATKNTVVISGNSPVITIQQSEIIPEVVAFRVSYLILNLDAASTAVPIGAGMPSSILVYSARLSSITNNNYSFLNGYRKNIIAAYPLHLGSASTVGVRTTWKFHIKQEFTLVHSHPNLNIYDVAIGFDAPGFNGLGINLGTTDYWSVGLEFMTGKFERKEL